MYRIIHLGNIHYCIVSLSYTPADFYLLLLLIYGDGGLVSQSCLTLTTPWTVACQAPLSMGFSRQNYWSRLLCPPQGDLSNPVIEPVSPALQAHSLLNELQGKLSTYRKCLF